MAIPYALWPSGVLPQAPHNLQYAIPAIPPSSNPLIVDPAGAIRDFTEHATSGDRTHMCTSWDLSCLEDWSKDEANRKVIMEVVKSRLNLGWPYNYKALDLLSVMPPSEYIGLYEKLKSLNESPASTEGSADLKRLAKPLVEKADVLKRQAEEEEARKKQEAIAAMWGGLWANDSVKGTAGLAAAGHYGWQYPYQVVPGVPAQTAVEWRGNPPSGWTPYVLAPVPLGNYPMLGWPKP